MRPVLAKGFLQGGISGAVGTTSEWARGAMRDVLREGRLSWAFIAGDLSSAVVPALLFSLAAWKSDGARWDELPSVLGRSLLYFWLYIYAFCLPNQITAIEEDRRNKPYRPLVVGAVSLRGAWVRWLVVMVAFSIVGAWLGVFAYTLLWQVLIIGSNILGGARSWVFKNLSMSLGIVAQLGAAWQMMIPLTPTAWRWILLPAVVIFPLISLQDLRDVEGDRVIGRRTFPLVFGERATRILLGIAFALLPLAVHGAVMGPSGARWSVWMCEGTLALMALVIAARVLLLRSKSADHHTYMFLTYWYCLLLVSAIVIL